MTAKTIHQISVCTFVALYFESSSSRHRLCPLYTTRCPMQWQYHELHHDAGILTAACGAVSKTTIDAHSKDAENSIHMLACVNVPFYTTPVNVHML